MIKTLTLAILAVLLSANLLHANEYEVRLGDKTYSVKEGEKQTITTPKGEELVLQVRKKPTLNYTGKDLFFTYSSDMKFSEDKDPSGTFITVECADSTMFMAQIFPYKIEADAAVDMLVSNFKEEFKGVGAIIPEESVSKTTKTLAGAPRNGKKLTWHMANLKNETEVYAFEKDGITIACIFQVDEEDKTKAKKLFKIISDSIR